MWIIFCITNLIAGCLCIFAVLRPSGIASSKVGVLIIAAILADMLSGLTFAAQGVHNLIGYYGPFSRVCRLDDCFLAMFARVFFTELTVKFLFAASFDRFISVCWPKMYEALPDRAYKVSVVLKVVLAELTFDLLGYWSRADQPSWICVCSLNQSWYGDNFKFKFTRDLLLTVARLAPLAVFTVVYTVALYKSDKKGGFGLKPESQAAKQESKVNKCVLFLAFYQLVIYWAGLSVMKEVKRDFVDAYADLFRLHFGLFSLFLFNAVVKYRRD